MNEIEKCCCEIMFIEDEKERQKENEKLLKEIEEMKERIKCLKLDLDFDENNECNIQDERIERYIKEQNEKFKKQEQSESNIWLIVGYANLAFATVSAIILLFLILYIIIMWLI